MSDLIETCPYCGDTRLHFNPAPVWRHGLVAYDEGDLFVCEGCGGNGESKDLIEIEPEEENQS